MKCEEAEKQIYLYRELSQHEQREVDQHVSTCKACQKVMQNTQYAEVFFRKAAHVIPQPRNHAQLTQRILTSIKKKEQHSFISTLFDYLNGYFTRYAFAALSVFMVVVFVSEYSKEEVILPKSITVNTGGPILSTSALRENFRQRKQRKEEQPVSHYAHYKKLYSNKTL